MLFRSIVLSHIDIGGGLGISYDKEEGPDKSLFISTIVDLLKPLETTILIEPGRSIVGEAGLLVSKVINTKKSTSKNFIIVDAGMTDLLRPPLRGRQALRIIPLLLHCLECAKF